MAEVAFVYANLMVPGCRCGSDRGLVVVRQEFFFRNDMVRISVRMVSRFNDRAFGHEPVSRWWVTPVAVAKARL